MGRILEHHGVKGMKWGVRKDNGHEGESARTSKIEKLDKKFSGNRGRTNAYYKSWSVAAKQMNSVDVVRINNKSEYKGQDFRRNSPLRQKYYAEMQKAFMDNLEKAVGDLGTNASGTKKYTIVENPNGSWDVTTVDVKHDDSSFNVAVRYDETGHIVGVTIADGAMTQSDDILSSVLSHHGVKGMRWGTRKGSSETTHEGASSDHIVAEQHKATVRSSGVKALSNSELQQLVTRMNLEKQHRDLTGQAPTKVDKGHNHVKKVLKIAKTVGDIYNTANSPAGKALRTAITK